MIALDAG